MHLVLIGALVVAGAVASTMPAQAQYASCHELWVERNSIFKARGYCFKTRRAISYFGNAGCRYDYEEDVPLSAYERAYVARIRAAERALGCR